MHHKEYSDYLGQLSLSTTSWGDLADPLDWHKKGLPFYYHGFPLRVNYQACAFWESMVD